MLDEISWSSFLNVSGALSDYLSSICGILNYEKLAEHSFSLIGAWRLCVCGGCVCCLMFYIRLWCCISKIICWCCWWCWCGCCCCAGNDNATTAPDVVAVVIIAVLVVAAIGSWCSGCNGCNGGGAAATADWLVGLIRRFLANFHLYVGCVFSWADKLFALRNSELQIMHL